MGMITIRNGHYRWQAFALRMDFAIAPNSITAIAGPSGAGKSTVLDIISGFATLSSGQLLLNGVDHTHTPSAQRPVSFVFQDNNTFAHMSARDNVGVGISPSLKLNKAEMREVDAALEKVGLLSLGDRLPSAMSGGERQRIALARVLVRQRPILLLDEAFAALGPALRQDMLQLVRNLQRELKLTVLMVTHQPEDARMIADRVMFVDQGQVYPAQSVPAFFQSMAQNIRAYLD
jgi:thiamine transport system ATP-binding protein